MRKTVLAAILSVASTLAVTAVSAAPITYDFSVLATTGPLSGVSSSGFFTFDDSIIPGCTPGCNGDPLLTDLSFTWNSIAYDETTANTGQLSFNATGGLSFLVFGTDCILGGGCDISQSTESWLFIGPGSWHYQVGGTPFPEGFGHGDTTLQLREVAAPEPASLALLSLGLVALGAVAWTRRRKVSLYA